MLVRTYCTVCEKMTNRAAGGDCLSCLARERWASRSPERRKEIMRKTRWAGFVEAVQRVAG